MAKVFYIHAGGRKRRIFRRKFSGNWHVRIERKGKDHLYSLGTTLEHVAKIKAKEKIENVINADFLALEQSKERTGYCTVTALLEHYTPSPDDVDPDIARNNRSQLRLLLREGGVDPHTATAAVFADGAVIKSFQKKRMDAVRSADRVTRRRAAVTANSTLTQARSILSEKYMDLYSGLKLPDLAAFRAVPRIKVRVDMSFIPFPAGAIERLDVELPQQSRNVQVAALLMRYAGLRNKEVQYAKWEWFRRWANGSGTLSVELRPYFRVKNQSVRTIELDPPLVALLAPFWGRDDEWIIDAPHSKARYLATHDEINAWLRQILPDRPKCAYELRKHAGSVVLTRPESEGGGLAAAARFLGDTIQTTEKHYARFLKPVHAVRAGECGTHLQVLVA